MNLKSYSKKFARSNLIIIFRDELARLMAELDRLEKEIAAARLEADVKIRHLTNQFLK